MSSITLNGSRLMQRVGSRTDELGYLHWDASSETCVLWLKDNCGFLGLGGGHIRGGEFASMEDAKSKALSSPSAFIMHWMWLRTSVQDQVADELEKNWDEITSELEGDLKREVVRARVTDYLGRLPVEDLKKWGGKIRDGIIVTALVSLIGTLADCAPSLL